MYPYFWKHPSTLNPEWKELGTLHFHHVGEKQSRQSCACKPLQSSSLHLRHGTNATATIGPFRRLHNPYSLLDRCHVLVRFLRVGTKDVTTHTYLSHGKSALTENSVNTLIAFPLCIKKWKWKGRNRWKAIGARCVSEVIPFHSMELASIELLAFAHEHELEAWTWQSVFFPLSSCRDMRIVNCEHILEKRLLFANLQRAHKASQSDINAMEHVTRESLPSGSYLTQD